MAHVTVNPQHPGMRSLLVAFPHVAPLINDLANVLLFEPNSLTQAEREMIATAVSAANECTYCSTVHKAIAAHHCAGDYTLVNEVLRDYTTSNTSNKFKALLAIALQVRQGGAYVTDEAIAHARACGATDIEIHDTVLIAASFCFYNRYVDGLATPLPEHESAYDTMGKQRAEQGYAVIIP
jgi:uncharacterized peroxidase-related enzyme